MGNLEAAVPPRRYTLMTQPRNVLFLMEDLCYGGTQRQTLQLAVRMDRRKYTVSMLTLTGETDLDGEARKGGIRLYHLGTSRKVAPFFFVRLPFFLRRLAPDILVPCTALPNIWGRIWGRSAAAFGKKPLVVGTVRGGGAPQRQHEKMLWRLADGVICNSEALKNIMLRFGVPDGRLRYIPNGVNTDFFRPALPVPSQRAQRVSCLARLAGDKDHKTLLTAFEKLVSDYPQSILRLVGDGPLEKEIHERILSSSAKKNIELFPGTPDVREHYAVTRIFALSSLREGQPNVLLEAMAAGLPICATSVGGIPHLVKDGVNGYLCPPGDSGALARNLARLLADPHLADAMGQANRDKAVQDFSFSPMVAAHEAFFESLSEGKNKSRMEP